MNGYGEVFSLVIDMSLMDTQRSSEAGVANQTEEEGGVDDGGSEQQPSNQTTDQGEQDEEDEDQEAGPGGIINLKQER